MSNDIVQLKKISAKSIGLDRPTLMGNIGAVVARIIGRATRVMTGETNLGAYTALLGAFEAQNLVSGAKYRAGKLFLPACDELKLIVDAVGELPADGGSVDFAVDLSTAPSDKGFPYSWVVTPLFGGRPVQPIDELLARMKLPAVKLIEAPKATGKKGGK